MYKLSVESMDNKRLKREKEYIPESTEYATRLVFDGDEYDNYNTNFKNTKCSRPKKKKIKNGNKQ